MQAAWAVGGGLFVLLAGAQIALGSWYGGRIYPGVKVADVQVGGMQRFEARAALKGRTNNHTLAIKVSDRDYNLKPEEVGASYDINTTLDQAYLQGRDQWLVPLGIYHTLYQQHRLRYAYTVDQKVLQKFIDKVVASSGQAPVDATVVITNGVPTVQPDAKGKAIASHDIETALSDQIADVGQPQAHLEPTVQVARIQAKDVAPAIEQTKQILAVPITITYQGKVFKPVPAQMSDWFTFEKSDPNEPAGLKPKVSTDGIKHYLQTVSKQINVNPINHEINVENGVSSEAKAGQTGLSLDQDSLATKIALAATSKQALTVEANMITVPFQTIYNRTVSLNYGKYIEVNLSRQHLWVYQDHQVIFDSPITSGATGAGFPTVTGLFSIQSKQTNRNLNGYAIGYNYNVFVKYWMPFFGDYGLHDASWRSAFGGQDYYYGGSHGCVNMPEATAAFIYGWADVGTPVWVHK